MCIIHQIQFLSMIINSHMTTNLCRYTTLLCCCFKSTTQFQLFVPYFQLFSNLYIKYFQRLALFIQLFCLSILNEDKNRHHILTHMLLNLSLRLFFLAISPKSPIHSCSKNIFLILLVQRILACYLFSKCNQIHSYLIFLLEALLVIYYFRKFTLFPPNKCP